MSDTYTQEELTALAIGELDEIRTAEIERLLADDPEARQTVEEIRSVAGLLTEQFAAEPVPELTAAQRLAVQSAVPYDRRRWWIPLSLAASILVMLGAAFLVAKYWPDSSTPIVRNPVKSEKKVRLNIEYPRAEFRGTQGRVDDPHVAAPSFEPPEPLYVPAGTSNLARGKAVTSNAQIHADRLKMVTDGDKSGEKGHYLELGAGLKWVQIDLGARANVYAIAVWHYYDDLQARAYRDVIVQVSGGPDFSQYTTVFNTDHDKSAGMETGSDMGYVETAMGKVIDCKGVSGRYVRLYSKGNTSDDQNHYVEVEVHAKRIGAKPTTVLTPAPTPTAQPSSSSKSKPARRRVKKVPLIIKYPKALFIGTPVPMNEPNICKPTGKPPETPMMPVGTVNLALGKLVTSNGSLKDLDMITDGDKRGDDGCDVSIGTGLKWVQIDLEAACSISAIGVWHYHKQARAYRDVVVHVSNDPDFIESKTIFNADHDNSSGLGIGEDMGYVETRHGKLIWCLTPQTVRYVRLYSKGNTSSDFNHYIEVEIYGRKPKGAAPTTRPAKTPTTRPAKTPTTRPAQVKGIKGVKQSQYISANPPTPTASPAPRSRAKSTRRRVKKVPFIIKYPRPLCKPTPVPIKEPNICKLSRKAPEVPMMPVGTVNLALGKPVTSNEPLPIVGELEMVTDGNKSGEDGEVVDVGFGLKWVQIDLQAAYSVGAIGLWHYHKQGRAYRDVVIQVSNDPDFIEFKTVFNSDHDNSAGLGIGEDMGYVETHYGKFIWCPKLPAVRYIRLYSKGNTSNDQNHYVEVEVYGRKPKGKSPTTRPAKTPTTKPADDRKVKKVPLIIKYPRAMFKCTPVPMPNEPNVPKWRQRHPELLVVPEGTVNLALGKPVTSNEALLVVGELEMVTDGDKRGEDGHNIDLGFGLKWVQIDLEAASDISAIGVWHYHGQPRAYRDVVVRVSNDPDFVTYTTVINTDFDNSSGLGIGGDMGYIETIYGKLIDCKGLRGRYVRLYSNGNTSNDQNHYIEVEVYGRKVKAPSPPKRPEGLAEREMPLKIKYPKRMFY